MPFAFTVLSNVTWLKMSTTRESISPNAPEKRVFVSVPDWNQLNAGENNAVITFTAIATGRPALVVPVIFMVTKNTLSSGFKGMCVCYGQSRLLFVYPWTGRICGGNWCNFD